MAIDWWTLALQTINFLVVVWLLSKFLYRPIRRVIEEREAADQKAAEAAQEKTEAADAAREEFEAKRAELSQTLREEEAKLQTQMENEREDVLEKARKEADKLLSDARAQIETERHKTFETLRDQIADLAQDLAFKALAEGGNLEEPELLARVSDYLDGLSEADMADLRADFAGASAELKIVTATPLSTTEQSRWRNFVSEHFGDGKISFETDPDIIGGAELRFAHSVLSFSVADRLRRAAAELKM
ncbi:F0F1 ATP synthase subunit delta [Marimonas lutisalis]|uniref:F0F1 ATP synthase subunit delta n=1 Tax=Marimonas lutisalis TaxID=2545756 RepID=UPI0010F68C95|nr:F0F1 ATP synthase subunit delta [Marimonas lutisalis]